MTTKPGGFSNRLRLIGRCHRVRSASAVTGGRRFWPIQCGTINPEAIKRDRDQLWAEAVTLFDADAPWWLADATAVTQAREQQADRYQEDPWQQPIAKYCEDRTDISIDEIAA